MKRQLIILLVLIFVLGTVGLASAAAVDSFKAVPAEIGRTTH